MSNTWCQGRHIATSTAFFIDPVEDCKAVVPVNSPKGGPYALSRGFRCLYGAIVVTTLI